MKGGRNRVMLLKDLDRPKDRLQLARDLDLDWKTVEHHVNVLLVNGLIDENAVYGNVKTFELTATGRNVLRVLEDSGRYRNRLSS